MQKLSFTLGHALIVASCAWLVWGGGLEAAGRWFGQAWRWGDVERAGFLVGCASLYWLRHLVTLFYLLGRRVAWGEVVGLLGFFACFELGLVVVGGSPWRDGPVTGMSWGGLEVLAVVLVLLGSWLNTGSELQRKGWKADPANRGHCYTGGLFRHAMHINYFGDTVLFTGWALLTGNLWTLVFPAVMASSFVFYHIPALDAYLAQRYGDEFRAYAARTKKFCPGLY